MYTFKSIILFACCLVGNPAFAGGFVNSRQQVIVQQKVVEFDQYGNLQVVAVPVTGLGLEYYYKVEDKLSEERIAELVVDKLLARLGGALGPTEGDQPKTTPAEPSKPTKTTADIPPVNSDPNKELHLKVFNIVSNKCATCHSAKNPKGGLVLVTEEGKLNEKLPLEKRFLVWDRTYGGDGITAEQLMPKNQQPLSDAEVGVLRAWARVKPE